MADLEHEKFAFEEDKFDRQEKLENEKIAEEKSQSRWTPVSIIIAGLSIVTGQIVWQQSGSFWPD